MAWLEYWSIGVYGMVGVLEYWSVWPGKKDKEKKRNLRVIFASWFLLDNDCLLA